jgi:hypothetical protein
MTEKSTDLLRARILHPCRLLLLEGFRTNSEKDLIVME